jgi:hypothetical protein
VLGPVRDQSRLFSRHTYSGAKLDKRRDPAEGFDVIQGWFYVGASLELYMLAAPERAPDRIAVRLQSKGSTTALNGCSDLELVVNGRAYQPIRSSVEKAPGFDRVARLESHFEVAPLRRLGEHAPTLTVRACNNRWTFAPTQVDAVSELLKAYDSLAAASGSSPAAVKR